MKPSEIIHLPIETLPLSAGWRLNALPRGLQNHAFQTPSSPTAVFFRSPPLDRPCCHAQHARQQCFEVISNRLRRGNAFQHLL